MGDKEAEYSWKKCDCLEIDGYLSTNYHPLFKSQDTQDYIFLSTPVLHLRVKISPITPPKCFNPKRIGKKCRYADEMKTEAIDHFRK